MKQNINKKLFLWSYQYINNICKTHNINFYHDFNILYRYQHSTRVFNIMCKIYLDNINLYNCLIYSGSAILHDIGRYQQYLQHKTNRDSFYDHGDIGYEIIINSNELKFLLQDDLYNVANIVKFHNKHQIIDDMKNIDILNALRTSDKIDILNTLAKSLQVKKYEIIAFNNLKQDLKISKNIMQSYKDNKDIKNNDIVTYGDKILSIIQWFENDVFYRNQYIYKNLDFLWNKIKKNNIF